MEGMERSSWGNIIFWKAPGTFGDLGRTSQGLHLRILCSIHKEFLKSSGKNVRERTKESSIR